MRNELYKAVAERYLQKYETLNKDVQDGGCSFRDIAANLVGSLVGDANELIEEADTEFDWKHDFMVCLRATRDYFRMLEQNEQFCLDELSKREGHFPDLRERAYSLDSREERERLFGESGGAHSYYVHLAKQRLKAQP